MKINLIVIAMITIFFRVGEGYAETEQVDQRQTLDKENALIPLSEEQIKELREREIRALEKLKNQQGSVDYQANISQAKQSNVEQVLDLYEENRSTEFADFHDKYLMLRATGFPNIYGPEYGLSLEDNDFDNPQKLLAYIESKSQKYHERLQNPTIAAQVKQQRLSYLEMDNASKDILDRKRINQEKMLIEEIEMFTKEGYYQYYKSKFSSIQDNEQLRIFIELDDSEVTNRAMQSYEEYLLEHQHRLSSVLASISESDFEIRNKNIQYSSYIEIFVTETGLDVLYQNSLVREIIKPESVTEDLNNYKGR